MRTLLRQLLWRTVARSMPGVLLLLFAVSQLSAIVDFPAVARELAVAPWHQRAALSLILVVLGAFSARRTLAMLRDLPEVRWFWTLPVPAWRAGVGFVALASVRTVWVGLVALLLGYGTALGVWFGAAALAAHPLGRSVRSSRRIQGTRSVTRWWARSPLAARVNRDLWALWRVHRGSVLVSVLLPLVLTVPVQWQLSLQWQDEGVATGALIFAMAVGVVPTSLLIRQSGALGAHWLPRQDPLSPLQATLALLISALLPGLSLVFVQSLVAIGGPRGLLQALALHGFFAVFAVWNVVRRPPSERRHAQGHAVFVSIFAGLACYAFGPPASLVLTVLSLLLFTLTIRRIR